MNWIERLYEIKNKDLYAQNGEGLILEYISNCISIDRPFIIDIGGGDGFYLSNSRHMGNLGSPVVVLDLEMGHKVTAENIEVLLENPIPGFGMFNHLVRPDIISIDIDGNDYWIIDKILSLKKKYRPSIICAEVNPAFIDARTIAYNPDHFWAGDNYYGFSFEAGKKLAEKHGYKVIFQLADMNMFMVRADLIEGLTFPEVTFKQNNFFKESNRTDWVMI